MNLDDKLKSVSHKESRVSEELIKKFSFQIFSRDRRNANNIGDQIVNVANKRTFDIPDLSLSDKIIDYIKKLTIKREYIEQELKNYNLKDRQSLKNEIVNIKNVSIIENKLIEQLKQLTGFRHFLCFNGIDDDSLKMSLKNLSHLYVPSGGYVFKQEEISTHFYGILKGKISIRVNKVDKEKKKEYNSKRANKLELTKRITKDSFKNSINEVLEDKKKMKDKKDYIYEEERMILEEGKCFGEWGLLYGKERTANALALEDSDLFALDKEGFEKSFGKCIFRAEADRKNFVLKTISFLRNIPKHKFDDIYKKIIPIFKNRYETVFSENTTAENIYIIYKGECKLTKIINKADVLDNKITNNAKYVSNDVASSSKGGKNDRATTLLSMVAGDIAGAESFLGNSSPIYKYSLQV